MDRQDSTLAMNIKYPAGFACHIFVVLQVYAYNEHVNELPKKCVTLIDSPFCSMEYKDIYAYGGKTL